MANKNFQNYAVAGNNVALTYDNVNDTVTFDVNVDKNDVGLGNVDNTSDINKPISTLVQNALNLKQDAITLTTTGSSGASTFAANVLNIPTYTLSGLGGQPLATNLTSISALTFASTSFVKMSAAGTFALDTNTYLTAEADTLASVTGRGNSTANAITVGGLTVNGTIQNTIGSANLFTSNILGGTTITLHSTTPSSSNYFLRASTNDVVLNSPISTGTVQFRIGNTTQGQFFGTTGNLTIQNGGTFTDSGFRLDVNGTARIQGEANVSFLTLGGSTAVNNSGTTLVIGASGAWAGVRVPRYFETTGSITAASAIARGVYMNQTLVAAANGDVLVGLDIQPTFTTGAFTGVTNYALRAGVGIAFRNDGVVYFGNALSGSNRGILSWDTNRAIISSGTSSTELDLSINLTTAIKIFTTRNVVIQNGGTFTDAGYRLDVVGADSRFNGIRAGRGAGQVASNTCFGNGVLDAITTGSAITAVGYQALNANTTAVDNTAFGYQAGFGITTGSYNTIIGNRISSSIAGASNCVLGTQINGTGSSNTIMGSFASTGGFNSSVILGRQATATASNQFVVGAATQIAGAVTTEINTSTQVWNVIINGTARKILLA